MRAIDNRDEALHRITTARRCLERAEEYLDSAGRWGLADLVGGRMITGLVKHGRIEEARGWIDEARPHLRRLREMDWQGVYKPGNGPGGFATVADFLFDGLLADLFVQSRIRELQEEIRRTLRQLARMEKALQAAR